MSSETSSLEVPKPYSFVFDKTKDMWVCSVHGPVDSTAWIPCWLGCEDGYFDAYDDDPINNDEGDLEICTECHGEGGWVVCAECNANNPDAEF
jgi:hypothetical protein